MARRIAVLVRERQGEALRVAVGLTLRGDPVEVFVLDRKLADTPANSSHLAALEELGMPVATNCADNRGLELLSDAQLARRIAACEVVVPY